MGSFLRTVRKSIRNASQKRQLLRRLQHAPFVRLIVGASGTAQNGWIPTEQQLVDLLAPESWSKFFDDASVDAILAEHVWEHLTESQGRVAAETCFRFLKPGGHLRVAVPDGYHPSPAYIDRVRPGGTGAGADDHKVLYNHNSFCELFESAGFETRLIEYFDQQGQFQNHDWDVADGFVLRTLRHDKRNEQEPFGYTSLFLDAIRPGKRPLSRMAA